jgi:hypothetical protein
MNAIAEILQQHPELAIFLTLALGFFLAKFGVTISCSLPGVLSSLP